MLLQSEDHPDVLKGYYSIFGAITRGDLTTREFVRCQAPAAGKVAHVDHPDSEWIRIDDASTMRICWSLILGNWATDVRQHEEAWKRGLWAGHSFEIVAMRQE